MKKLLSILIISATFISAKAQQQPICCPKFTLQSLERICDKNNECKTDPNPNGGAVGGNPAQGQSNMIIACKNQAYTYLVTPNLISSGFTYTWTVVGGSPATTSGNPMVITWGNSSQGFIQVIISGPGGCRDTIRQKVCLLTGPTANITVNSPGPYCAGQSVCFSDLGSVGAASWYWDFGDGTSSTSQNPCHTFAPGGPYTVTLTVSSSAGGTAGQGPDCGCKDTAQTKITISNKKGIEIKTDDCRKMLCKGDTVKYCTTTAGCSGLTWSVNGGQIIGPTNGTCVTIVWNNPPVNYPTSVTLNTTSCPGSVCGNSATLNVPVLYPNLPIQGPYVVCPNAASTYSLPALPGTFYKWTISGGGTITSADSNHNVINVQWGPTPGGPFIITCNYNNPYSGCSGTDTIGVFIKPPFKINGPSPVCTGIPSFYNVMGGGSANWTVTPNSGFTPPGPFPNVPNIVLNWSVAGNYTIGAVPFIPANYCTTTDSLKVVVNPTPVLNPITGPNPVCPNQLYTYSVTSNMSGGSFSWSFISGTGNVSGYGPNNSNASVLFTGAGPWQLQATQTVNGCTGKTILNISKVPPPTLPASPITACIGGQINITVATGTGPFTWSTSPNVSLISGQGTSTATYEIHGNGTITVSNCGGTSNAVTVTATTPPAISITQTGSLCAGNLILSAPAGTAYQWAGGSNATTQTINVTQPGTYIVQVTLPGGCKSVAQVTIPPVPLPSVTISTGSPLVWCNPTVPNVLLQAFTLSTGCSYQWYKNNNSNPVGTNSATYTATSAGNYYVVITCGGCVATSNVITVQQINCTSGGAGCNGPNPLGPITVTGCNPKTFSVSGSCTGGVISWNFGDGGNATGSPATHTYANTGAYPVTASITCSGCTYTVIATAEVPVKANFISSVVCGINGNNTITLNNTSQVLGGWSVTSVNWTSSCGSPTSGTGNSFTFNTSGCSPTVTMNITVTNTSTGQSCSDSKTFIFNLASASLAINGPDTVCVNQPYSFSSSLTTGILLYAWTVNGNPASQNNPLTYTFSGTPVTQTVALTVTDSYGCTYTKSKNVIVVTPPALTITPSPLVKICPDCVTPSVTLTANPSGSFYNFQWYHNGTAVTGANSSTYQPCTYDASGNYWVTANSNGPGNCLVKSDTVKVVYYPKPNADIQGSAVQCQTGTGPYNISLQNGSASNPNYTYNWTATGPGTVTYTPDNLQWNVGASATALGTYQFIVTVTDVTTGCVAKDTFCVYLYQSPTVTVSGPSTACEGTPTTWTITNYNPSFIYQWSNGATGQTMTTSSPGMYMVSVTDPLSGCFGNAFAGIIHKRPYVDLFPIGCDTLCDTAKIIPPLPLFPGQTYPGVYTIQWYVDGNLYFTGSPLVLTGLSLGWHQIYIVVTDIATGCKNTSGKYDVYIKHCGDCDCKGSKWDGITLSEGEQQPAKANIGGIKLECKHSYELKCNQPYTINAGYICKDSACMGKVTYSLQPPSGPAITSNTNPFTFTPTVSGVYTLTIYGWCGDKKCDSCIIDFKVNCVECDCKGSHWGDKTYTINNVTKPLPCLKNNDKAIDVKCKQPININAVYNCAKPDCESAVEYSLTTPSGTSTGTLPLTFTPNQTGTYTLVLYGYCGGVKCDSCVVRFKTNCDSLPCCPYEIKVEPRQPTYVVNASPASTTVTNSFGITIPATANITEVRANVVSYTIDDNYKGDCMKCVNLPFTWASVASATNINAAPPKITMYGGATVPSFNGSGAGAYQNPREVVWNNGSNLNTPNITNIGMSFILPPTPSIDCCELKGRICVKFTFRDSDCKECEAVGCFEFVIKKK